MAVAAAAGPMTLEGRTDLRDLALVTIDGADARDYDDAVWAQKDAAGWRIIVAIADVAAYAYIAHAPEGGVSLADYPLVRAWIDRVQGIKGFVPMQASPIPEIA